MNSVTTGKNWSQFIPKTIFLLALMTTFAQAQNPIPRQSSAAERLDISYSFVNPYSGSINKVHPALLLSGPIKTGDYERLLRFIGKDTTKYWEAPGITLASSGGDVREALKIADLFKQTYKDINVGSYTGKCASSCFLIFASATKRMADPGTLGVHRPYFLDSTLVNLSPRELESGHRRLIQVMRELLTELMIPSHVIDAMFSRASTEIYWLTEDDLEKIGTRSPWYEQLLIARCSLDKSVEQEYRRTSDDRLLPQMMRYWRCGDQLTGDDALNYLQSELSKL